LSSRALILALAFAVASCGFRLRGTAGYVQALLPAQRRDGLDSAHIRRAPAQRDRRPRGDAVIQFQRIKRKDPVVQYHGLVREFQLRYRVGFRVHDGKGTDYVPSNVIQLTRDVTYNDAEILAKEQEEQLLFRDMQADMVQQIMRRLAAAKPPAK
jgi:LPS-assembly lipoprotein